jgi:hypothetical protein
MTTTVLVPDGPEKVRWLLGLSLEDGASISDLRSICKELGLTFDEDRLKDIPKCKTQKQLANAIGCESHEFSQWFPEPGGKKKAEPRVECVRALAKTFGFAPKDYAKENVWAPWWRNDWHSFMPSEDSKTNQHAAKIAKDPVSASDFKRRYAEKLVKRELTFQGELPTAAEANRSNAKGGANRTRIRSEAGHPAKANSSLLIEEKMEPQKNIEKQSRRRFFYLRLAMAGSYDASDTSASAGGIPMCLSLHFHPRGWPVDHDLTVGVREVDVQLIDARARGGIEISAFECSEGEGNFTGKTDGDPPYWTVGVKGDEPGLAGTRRRNDGRDCICRGFEAGDEIVARMTARLNDCFVQPSGRFFIEESPETQRFLDHLRKLEALGGAEAILDQQVLEVVEKP